MVGALCRLLLFLGIGRYLFLLSGFNVALVDIVDSWEDDIQLGGLIKEDLGRAVLAFEHKIWFFTAVVGKYRLEHVVEVGQLVGVVISW